MEMLTSGLKFLLLIFIIFLMACSFQNLDFPSKSFRTRLTEGDNQLGKSKNYFESWKINFQLRYLKLALRLTYSVTLNLILHRDLRSIMLFAQDVIKVADYWQNFSLLQVIKGIFLRIVRLKDVFIYNFFSTFILNVFF